MRNPFLLTALVAAISGCTSPPKTTQVQADAWVDEQIAQSASAISLAQRRLHQTSPSQVSPAARPVAAQSSVPMTKGAPAVTTPVPASAPITATVGNGKPASAAAIKGASPATAAVSPAAKTAPPVAIAVSKDFPAPVKPVPPVVVATTKPAPKPVVPAPIPKPVWVAAVGGKLSGVIADWSERAKFTLDWQCKDLDYPIEAPLRFEGSFEDAVISIFKLYEKADRSFTVDGRLAQRRLIVAEDLNKSKRAGP